MTMPLRLETAEQVNVRGIVAYLEGLQAGTTVWYGSATGAWWAMVQLPSETRLVEACSPKELRQAIISAGAWPWPRR